jgi:hypothetical protein
MSTLGVFNLSTKVNSIAGRYEEGVHYKIVKDGNGLEYKIINFENSELCPREGIVELEPLKVQKRHLNDVSFRVVRDREMDVLVGIPLSIDPKTKEIIFQKITLREKETFDLSDPNQAMKWACIKRSHFYVDSPNFQTSSKTKYKAIDKEAEAVKFQMERRTKRKAVDIAESLVGQELEEMAYSIGIDPKVMSPSTLWVEVVKYAESKAEDFMKIWNSDTREELITLKRAIAAGVVSQTLEAGINYNGLTLGFNEPEAVNYLKTHPSTKVSIDAVSRKQSHDGQVSMISKEPVKIKDEKDAEIERLKRLLAEKESLTKFATEKALELQAEVDIMDADPELAELIKKAKALDIRGVHNMKDKAKIRAKIAEKEKSLDN